MISVGPWEASSVVAKACVYGGTFVAGGGYWFLAYNRDTLGTGVERIRSIVRVGLCLALTASAAKVLLTAASMAGDASGALDAGLDGMVVRGGEGWALAARVAGLLAMMRTPVARPSLTALLGSLVAVTSFAWVGHVHASGFPASGLLIVHLMAAAFWFGALLPLYSELHIDDGAPQAEVQRLAMLVSDFGRHAVPVVSSLILVGAGMAWLLLRGADWAGDYPRLLLGKMAAVGGLLSVASFNHRRLTPRLMAGDRTAVTTLRRSILVEMVFAAGVLLITAAMTTLTGP